MLRHIVLLRFRDDAPPGHAAVVVEALRALPSKVPSIRRYDVAPDLGLTGDTASVVVVAHFDDEEGFRAYREHPDHVAVIEGLILPALESRLATQTLDAAAEDPG